MRVSEAIHRDWHGLLPAARGVAVDFGGQQAQTAEEIKVRLAPLPLRA
jgi:hypothetical protein